MSDKAPGKPSGKKPGKTLKEKPDNEEAPAHNGTGPMPTTDRRHP